MTEQEPEFARLLRAHAEAFVDREEANERFLQTRRAVHKARPELMTTFEMSMLIVEARKQARAARGIAEEVSNGDGS